MIMMCGELIQFLFSRILIDPLLKRILHHYEWIDIIRLALTRVFVSCQQMKNTLYIVLGPNDKF